MKIMSKIDDLFYLVFKKILPAKMFVFLKRKYLILTKFRKFKKPFFKKINVANINFYLLIDRKNGKLDREIFLNDSGIYEKVNTFLMLNSLKNDDIFLDIGANIGYFTNLYGKYLENGKVISFEPIKRIYLQNLKSVKKNLLSNVELYNFACGQKKGADFIYTNHDNVGGSSIYKEKQKLEKREGYDSYEKIKIIKLDDFLDKKQKVDFVKIDVEGFEYDVLRGMENIIKRERPKMLIEFSSYIYEGIERGRSEKILDFLFKYYNNIQIAGNDIVYKNSENLSKKVMHRQSDLFCWN